MVLCLAGFLVGAVKLFTLSFERGDVYPAYSSLRSDPLGVRVLYESLKELGVVEVDRNYHAMARARMGPEDAWLYLGARPYDRAFLNDDFKNFLGRLSTAGGRLVVCFYPKTRSSASSCSGFCEVASDEEASKQDQHAEPDKEKGENESAPPGSPGDSKDVDGDEGGRKAPDDEAEKKCDSVFSSEGLGVAFAYSKKDDIKNAIKLETAGGASLPREIAWHSTLYFESLEKSWKTIYAREGRPVIIERQWGLGSIVISSDVYLFSNEAMRRSRYPGLLAWFTGAGSRVIFDESHLGIVKSRGVATLARKYRLHGLFFALVFLAALFIWKNAVSLIPTTGGSRDPGETPPASKKDGAEGLLNLMRGNIPREELLDVCLAAWEKSAARDKRISDKKIEEIRALVQGERAKPKKERDPVKTYRRIHQVIKEEKGE
ncbi:MAG: hypothetical protein GY859_16630 [Desulfobacterales bacterium]|nr:hypothetical protein [Desulfobacterales bacterium]